MNMSPIAPTLVSTTAESITSRLPLEAAANAPASVVRALALWPPPAARAVWLLQNVNSVISEKLAHSAGAAELAAIYKSKWIR